jgi:hypothetical protein
MIIRVRLVGPRFSGSARHVRLLDLLGDDALRSVAVWKMEGYPVEEIAARLEVVPRTVERQLAILRTQWSEEKVS